MEEIKRPFFKDTYIAGKALTTLRTVPMIVSEMMAGLSASDIFFYRSFYAMTNFPAGYFYKEGRELGYKGPVRKFLEKKLPESIVNGENFNKNVDRVVGIISAGVDAAFSYGFYKLSGVHKEASPIIPAVVSAGLTLVGGGITGSMIDSYRDASSLEYHKDRSVFSNKKYFPLEPSIESKKKLTDRVDMAVWYTLACGLLITNYPNISRSLENLFK